MKTDWIILTSVSENVLFRGIGAYIVADSLRKYGLTVQVIDFTDYFTEEELLEAVESFIGPNTKAIGVSSTFYQEELVAPDPKTGRYDLWNRTIGLPKNIISTITNLKTRFPNISYILGGANSYLHERYPVFDYVFHSFSDNSIIEFLKNKHRIYPVECEKKIIEGEQYPVDATKLRHHWHENDLIFKGEVLPIEIGRGCIFKCKFCNFQLTGKKKFDYIRDIEQIKDELIENYEQFGTVNYSFTEDTFNDSTYKLEQLHLVTRDLPFKINFVTYLRLDLLSRYPEQIPLLKELGLRSAFFGIESLNQKSATFVGKGMGVNKAKDFLLELRNDHFKDDITFICSMIIGLPYETVETVTASYQWMRANDINTLWVPLFIRPDHRYKSDIDINYEKYGYKIENSKWSNEHMTQNEAYKLSVDFRFTNSPTMHSWNLMMLANLGIWSIDELVRMRVTDLDMPRIFARRDEMVIEYKNRLNELRKKY
jgi:hypothetical protein